MANLGNNSTSTLQAIVRVMPEGCLTPALAALLQSNIVIEFPDSAPTDGRIDVLSANALVQIATQLAESDPFRDLVVETMSSPEVIEALAAALIANPDFAALVNEGDIGDADKQTLGGIANVAVDAALQVTVPIEAARNYSFTYSLAGAGVDFSGNHLLALNLSEVVIALPNAVAGDNVGVHWTRYLL
jgi:hypothetical protein